MMKKKRYLAAAGLVFGGCFLGIGLGGRIAAVRGTQSVRLTAKAEETVCESSGTLS